MIWWIILAVVLTYFFWEEIKSPFVEHLQKIEKNKSAIIAAERIARVKMLSDVPKDIEEFICKNVNMISDETMNALVARLEDIKSDKIIEGDSLKNKIDALYKEDSNVLEDISTRKKSGKTGSSRSSI